jgi:penicillin-binding protein A
MGRKKRTLLTLSLALVLAGGFVGVLSADGGHQAARAARENGVSEPALPRAPTRGEILAGLDPLSHHEEGGVLVSDLPNGRKAVLTLDPSLQAHVTRELERYEVPYASLVAIEPSTGRVLAYVSHSSANPDAGDLALDPTPRPRRSSRSSRPRRSSIAASPATRASATTAARAAS